MNMSRSRHGKGKFLVIATGLIATALLYVGLTALPGPDATPGAAGPASLLMGLGIAAAAALWWVFSVTRKEEGRRLLVEERDRYREHCQRLEQDLQRSEQRFRQLLDHAGDAIFFIDPFTGGLLEVNRRTEELLGYTAEEIRALPPAELFPSRQRRRYLRLLKNVRENDYAEEQDLLFRRKDGHLFTGAVHVRLGNLGDTRVVHGVLRDVSDVRRIEQELRKKNRDLTLANEIAHLTAANRDLRSLLHSVLAKIVQAMGAHGGGIYLFRGDGNLLQLTAHQGIDEEILQEIGNMLPSAGLAGRIATSGRPRSSRNVQSDRRVFSQTARQAGWQGFQGIPLTAKGKTIGVLFLFSLSKQIFSREEVNLLLAIGKQVGIALEGAQLFEDLQWQHRLTRASNREIERSRRLLRENLDKMEEANRALERLDRMKSNFLALASHELRTPLTYVLSGSELLLSTMGDRLSGEENQILDAIYQGGMRLERIVQDLIEVAQIESQSLYLAREKIDLPHLLAELLQEYRPVFEKRDLTFTFDEFPASLELHGDAHHLKRAFGRLLENAIKFTPEGGRIALQFAIQTPRDIRRQEPLLRPFSPGFFQAFPAGPLLRITLRDSGVGIDPEEQVQVFEKFYGVGEITHHFTSRTRFGGKGVGLGLTLVKGLVEAHGGMVWVESRGTKEQETGSAFHLLLPLASGPTDESKTGRQAEPKGAELHRDA